MMRSRDNKLTFSIRKLTIGAVSVMFGALIFGVSTTQVHADTVDSSDSAKTEQVQTQSNENEQTSGDATKEAAPQENAKTEEQNDQSNQDNKAVEPAKVETQQDDNKAAAPVKAEQAPAQAQAKQDDATKVAGGDAQKADAQTTTENKTETAETVEAPKTETSKTEVPAQTTQNGDAKTETTTLDVAKASKEKNNASGLTTSLFRSEDVDTVNINDWSYSTDRMAPGDIEVKTKSGVTYVGDVVIPNTADLVKAGIITDPNGKAYIANGTLQNVTRSRGVTSITISKNDNSKLYVWDATLSQGFANPNGENPDLKKLDVGALDVSRVTNLDQTFQLNGNLTEIDGLDTWDVSHVTTMRNIFHSDPKLTSEALSGLSNWDTKNLEILHAAFDHDRGLTNLDFLKNWNTSKLNTMLGMVSYDPYLTNIDGLANWNTDSLQDLGSAFIGTGITNLDALRNWNTSNLTSMGAAFWSDGNLSDISGIANWDVSKVTNFASTFLYDSQIQGLVDLSNWEINDNANTFDMFYPGGREATPLMVIVKSGAENINKGATPFGAGATEHYLYKVEINGQVVETLPAKAFNSAEEAVNEIKNHLGEIATSRNLQRDGYKFSWKGQNQYGNTGAYQLYVANWAQNPTQPTQPRNPTQPTSNPGTSDTPNIPDNPTQPTSAPSEPTTPVTPVQPTTAPVQPETPVTPAQPTTAPVKPENKPNKTKDNGKTVKPHAENVTKKTNRHGRKYAPAAAVRNTTKPQGTVLNNTQTKQHPQATALPNKTQDVVSANKKQNQKTLPQTGAKDSAGVLGFLLAGLGLFGFAADRKRKNN